MAAPCTFSAKLSQVPFRYMWHESWHLRYFTYAVVFVVIPLYIRIDKTLTGPENKAYWREKRRRDFEHHHKELEKQWEVKT